MSLGLVTSCRRRKLMEFAPSFGWFFFMFCPFVFQINYFHVVGKSEHMFSVVFILVVFFVADFFCFIKDYSVKSLVAGSGSNYWFIFFFLCFILPAIGHLFLMPKIPIVVALFEKPISHDELMVLRHDSAKFLDVPSLIKYVFNWSMTVFAPLFILLAFAKKHWWKAMLGFVAAAIYSAATLAKFPLVQLVVTCLIAACFIPSFFKIMIIRFIAFLIIISAFSIAIKLYDVSRDYVYAKDAFPANEIFKKMDFTDPRLAFTYGDILRNLPKEKVAQSLDVKMWSDYILYRAWLTPIDVTNRWYQYYSYVHKERILFDNFYTSWSGVDALTPSRQVGLWAYRDRFPDKYLDTVNASASFDSDAFARSGTFGVLIATCFLVLCRLFAALMVVRHPVSIAAYGVVLSSYALLPSSASLQAIFGAHGIFICFAILVFIYLTNTKSAFKHE